MSPRRRQATGVAVVAAIGLLFALGVRHAGELNGDVSRSDQRAYAGYTMDLHEAPSLIAGDRNRMPIFPWLVSLATPRSASEADVFRRGKLVNIGICVVGLVVVGAWSRRLGAPAAVAIVLMEGFGVLAFKAPFLQADATFYLLFTASAVLLWHLIARPSVATGGAAGLAVGLAHLTKAGVGPLVLVFVLALVGSLISSRRDPTRAKGLAAAGVALLVVGGATVAPYLLDSQRAYGSATYNVNASVYAWEGSWSEASRLAMVRGALPPGASGRPSPTNYRHDHSLGQAVHREASGLATEARNATRDNVFTPLLAVELTLALTLVVSERTAAGAWVGRHRSQTAFAVGTVTAYVLMFGWWMPIASGNRFILTLYLPAVIGLAVVIKRLGDRRSIRVRGNRVLASSAAFSVLLAVAVPVAILAATSLTAHWYGGT